MIDSKRDVTLQRDKLTKSPQSDKRPKQLKVPIRKKATVVPNSSNSENMEVPGHSWWLDNTTTGNAKHREETACEVKAEKADLERENTLTEEEDKEKRNSSSDEEQGGKAENQMEHARRENPSTDEAGQEETKTVPVKANAEWEVSHENPTTRKSGHKTKKPNWLGHNVMVKTIDREDTVAEEK